MKKQIPAYQRIKNQVLSNIHSGKWTAGKAIPPELTLAEHFNVSRMTVNRALKELSEEHVLERRQGSGTFVAQKHFNHTFVKIRNIVEEIRQTGKNYKAKVIYQGRSQLSELPIDMQNIFSEVQPLGRVDIIHYSDDTPVQYERRWVDADLIYNFADQDFNEINTSDYLINMLPLVKGYYVIHAKLAPKDITNHLKMNTNQPALLMTRHSFSTDVTRVVSYVEMWHDGDNYQFSGKL